MNETAAPDAAVFVSPAVFICKFIHVNSKVLSLNASAFHDTLEQTYRPALCNAEPRPDKRGIFLEQIFTQIVSVIMSMVIALGTLAHSFFPQFSDAEDTSPSALEDSQRGSTYSLDFTDYKPADIQKILLESFENFAPNMTFSFEEPLTKAQTKDFEQAIADSLYTIIAEHPEIFWIANKSYYLSWYYVDEDYTSLTLSFTYCETEASAKARQKEMDETVKKLLEKAPTDDTFRCLKYFHDIVASSAVYDSETAADQSESYAGKEDAFNITGVFLNNSAVCEGYAKAFKYLCDQVYIPCTVVFGSAYDSSHAWNYVTIEGKKYLVDTTWDDQDPTIYACFLKGKNGLVGKTPASQIYKADSKVENWSSKDYPMVSLLPKFRGEFIPNN